MTRCPVVTRFRAAGWRAVVIAMAVAAGAGPAAAQLPKADSAIQLDADSSDFDRRNNRLVFRNIRISQDGFAIAADQAESAGLEFRDSNWTFTGNVRIDAPNASISAATATLDFSAGRIVSATIDGAPATFRQGGPRATEVTATRARLKFSGRALSVALLDGDPAAFRTTSASDKPTRGEAGAIEYDVANGMLTLKKNAWLREGDNRISGNRITYNMNEERVLADSGGDGERVHITIIPPAQDGAAGDDRTGPGDDPGTGQ